MADESKSEFFEADDAGTPAEFDLADESTHEPAAPPKAEAKPAIPAWMTRTAERLGLDPSRYKSEEALDAAIDVATERLATRERAVQHGLQQRAPEPPPPAEDEFDWGETEVEDDYGRTQKRKLTEKDIGPTARFIKEQQKRIADLQKRLDERDQRDTQAEHVTYIEVADEAFAALGEQYHAVLGKDKPGADTPELERRQTVWNKAAEKVAKLGRKPSKKEWAAAVSEAARRLFAPAPVPPPAARDNGESSPSPGGYGGRRSEANGTPPEQPAPRAVRERDPLTGHFLSNEQADRVREDRERQEAFFRGGVSERPTSRRSPAESKGRQAAIEYMDEQLQSLTRETSPTDEYDDQGRFIP